MSKKHAFAFMALTVFLLEVLEPSSSFVRETELRSTNVFNGKNNIVVSHLNETVNRNANVSENVYRARYRRVSIIPREENAKPLRCRVLSVSCGGDLTQSQCSLADLGVDGPMLLSHLFVTDTGFFSVEIAQAWFDHDLQSSFGILQQAVVRLLI